jgi:23S rRNA (cytosine1962-C5)-methyltransferase
VTATSPGTYKNRARPWYTDRVSTRVELRRDASRHGPHDGPWIRKRQVGKIWGPADPAALAALTDYRDQTLAWGLLAPDTEIPLRIIHFGQAPPPADWMPRRLDVALAARTSLATPDTTAYREVNSEGDGLPGLTIDRYGDDRVVQVATAAMAARLPAILDYLATRTAGRLFVTSPAGAAEREQFPAPGHDHGDDAVLEFRERGLLLRVPAPPAQKTGAYLDQRDNRRLLAELSRGTGGPLLDVGCHVGGFALHAAALGVDAVGLDQSAKALAHAAANAAANGLSERTQWIEGDMFGPLDHPRLAGPFGALVFDPPRVASSVRDVARATATMTTALGRLLGRVRQGGFAAVCSCSHHLGRAELDAAVLDAGGGAWTRVHALGPGADHPVWPGHREGDYLRVNVYQRR